MTQTEMEKQIDKIMEELSWDNKKGSYIGGGYEKYVKKISSLFSSELSRIRGEVEKMKCYVPEKPTDRGQSDEDFMNEGLKYTGRFNYNKALSDVLALLGENKEGKG